MNRGRDELPRPPADDGRAALATADEDRQAEEKSDPERQDCTNLGIKTLTDHTKLLQEEDRQESSGMSRQKVKIPTHSSVTKEERWNKSFLHKRFLKGKKEKCTPHDKMAPTGTTSSHKGKPALTEKEDSACCTKKAQTEGSKTSQPNQDNCHNSGTKLSTSVISFPVESSVDFEEDMYRDAEEIKREKVLLVCGTGSSEFLENKLSVEPEVDIMEYCQEEWRGNTAQAKCIRKGYEAVSHRFISIRRVRGDNYCAVRATLFQALSQATQLPDWLQEEDMMTLPQKLITKYDWIGQWQLRQKWTNNVENLVEELKECLVLLKRKWKNITEMKTLMERQAACDELFRSEDDEYRLYEAVKFLMLNTAIKLYEDNEKGKEVPVFAWLLFARDTSSNPSQLMENHLNQLGHTGGLEQVSSILLCICRIRSDSPLYARNKEGKCWCSTLQNLIDFSGQDRVLIISRAPPVTQRCRELKETSSKLGASHVNTNSFISSIVCLRMMILFQVEAFENALRDDHPLQRG